MPEFSGLIQALSISHLLVVLLAVPALGAALHGARDGRDAKSAKVAERVALATALAAIAIGAMLLGQRSGERLFVQHVVRWLRAGQLDANLDLAADPATVVALLAASALAYLGAASKIVRAPVLLAAFALVALSGDLVGMVMGVLLLAVASGRLLGRARALPFVAAGVLSFATALLFWATGGGWHDDGFDSDFRARLAPVVVGETDVKAPPTTGVGLLTATALPGSALFLDDSRSPYERDDAVVRTPFARLALPAGKHTFRLHPGMGQDDQLIAQQTMGNAQELALVPVGSTVSPRELDDELALRDASGAQPWRTTFLARTLAGPLASLRVAPTLGAFLLLYALLQAASAALVARRGLVAADRAAVALSAIAGAFVVVRMQRALAVMLPGALVWGVAAVALVLALSPLLTGRSAKVTAEEDIETTKTSVDLSPGEQLDAFFVSLPARLTAPFGAGAKTKATATATARTASVDAAFAAVVALVVVLLVAAR